MPSVREFRAQHAQPQPEKSSVVPLIGAAIAAFAIGALAVLGWEMLPSNVSNLVPGAAQSEPKDGLNFASTEERVGRASTAPILKLCMQSIIRSWGLDDNPKAEPADIYRILQAGGSMARIANIVGRGENGVDTAGMASGWSEVAQCVYQQNGRMLCDPDNRALAIEAANALVRQVDIAANAKDGKQTTFAHAKAELRGDGPYDRQYAIQQASAAKDRVLNGLRTRLQEGRLVAADFGVFPAGEVRKILNETKTLRNACAEEDARR